MNLIRERRLPTATYPLRGFAHFAHHPRRHAGPIGLSILKVVAASAVAIVPLYKYGYDFQRGLIKSVYRHIITDSVHMASLMVSVTSSIVFFLESSLITMLLANHFVGSIEDRLFDSVVQERNGMPDNKVVQVTEKVAGPASLPVVNYRFFSPVNLMVMSAQLEESWRMTLLQPTLFVMTLPLNLVPFIGPVCFVAIQALFVGGKAHRRYFKLYQWTPAQRQRRIEQYFWQYQRFGMVATALEMVPFVGYLFMYTNFIGGALWAMDLHDAKLLEPTSKKTL
ncbi:hypothetical protein BDF21DRAFT_343801 [Thamnidium elegans]|nr:hypothetical protein BDF21DRAFT_343801 [Thamnidium elegans]